MLTVHHLNNSRSQRILWLLEELGVPYQITRYERDSKTMLAPESLRAVHPLGKSPVVTGDGETLAESGAIIEILVDRHGPETLRPAPGTAEYRQYLYWLHYAEGSLMPPLLLRLVFGQLSKPPMPWAMRPIGQMIAKGVNASFIGPRIKENMTFINGHLEGRDFFAGEGLSGADIQMTFPLEAGATRVNYEPYPNIRAFLARMHAREAYQRALERGGPYDYA